LIEQRPPSGSWDSTLLKRSKENMPVKQSASLGKTLSRRNRARSRIGIPCGDLGQPVDDCRNAKGEIVGAALRRDFFEN
jgi:hypothetical protein